MDWVEFDEGESSWEPLVTIWDGAPQFVKSELRNCQVGAPEVEACLGGAFALADVIGTHFQYRLVYFLLMGVL